MNAAGSKTIDKNKEKMQIEKKNIHTNLDRNKFNGVQKASRHCSLSSVPKKEEGSRT